MYLITAGAEVATAVICGDFCMKKHYGKCGDCGKPVFNKKALRCRKCWDISRRGPGNCNFKHGLSRTPIHNRWWSMVTRTTDRNVRCFKDYGARGIKVCERWLVFENFYADMGDPPTPKHSLERENNDGNYEPGNCVWATVKKQANNKTSNVFIEYKGERKTIAQWSEALGIKYLTLYTRVITNKWSVNRAFETPIRKRTGIDKSTHLG